MKDALIVSVLSLTPRNAGARGVGRFARSRLSRLATRAFVAVYGVDLGEAEGTLADYPTLEDLFTRTLKPGARPVDDAPDALVSPVDGTCAVVGTTTDGRIEVAPGRPLDVRALLGEQIDDERDVAVLYLSPRDYHRVHVPREGLATRWRYVPGTLWPVFPAAVRRVHDLFSRNERFTVHIETGQGPLDVVLVGAFGVGRITTAVADLVTNEGARTPLTGALEPPRSLGRGAELGVFHLGSTVVLVAPVGRWHWTVTPGAQVRVGRTLGHTRTAPTSNG